MKPERRASQPEARRAAGWLPWLVMAACLGMVVRPAQGLERLVQTHIANAEEAPVLLETARVKLVQTYTNPNQFPLAVADGVSDVKVQRSRVRHINRLKQQVPTYQLEGTLQLRNTTRKPVDVVQLTVVFLNAFQQRISMEEQSLASPLSPRQMKIVPWSRGLPHEEVFELTFAVTAVRFSDGTLWSPAEEVVVVP